MFDASVGLPVELILKIMDQLSEHELHLVSAVSRRFRAIVSSHERFFLPIAVRYGPISVPHDRIDLVPEKMEHAIRYNVPISFQLFCSSFSTRTLYNTIEDSIKNILELLASAMHLVTRLSLTIPQQYETMVQSALNRPSPLLLSCTFVCSSDMRRTPHLPLLGTSFQSCAPKLESVYLHNVWPGLTPWTSVRKLRLDYQETSKCIPTSVLRLAEVFPSLRRLRIQMNTIYDHIDLRGVQLQYLVVACDLGHPMRPIQEKLDVGNIPVVVTLLGPPAVWDGLEKSSGLVLMARRPNVNVRTITIASSNPHRRPIRVAAYDVGEIQEWETLVPRHMVPLLKELHLTTEFVPGLVNLPNVFSALERLTIHLRPSQLLWGADSNQTPPGRLHCPNLRRIDIYSIAPDTRVVHVEDLLTLGRVLCEKQLEIAARVSVTLVLTDVRLWHDVPVPTTLYELFDRVEFSNIPWVDTHEEMSVDLWI